MEIRKFEDRDLEQVREICLSSFGLTSFHNDPVFTGDQAGAIVWELYAKPAVTKGRNFCFVAEEKDRKDKISGFVIYGSYSELARLTGRKMASIVLLAVRKEDQNSGRGIGRALVGYCLSFFRKNKVAIVTVGTDQNNFPALKIYTTSGFYPVLFWSTWRYHSAPSGSPPAAETAAGTVIRPVAAVPEGILHAKGPRLVSFLSDPTLTKEERQKIRDWHLRPGENQELVRLEVTTRAGNAGFCVYERERAVSELTGRTVFRLNDLYPAATAPPAMSMPLSALVKSVLDRCSSGEEDFTVEMFVRSDDWETAKALSDLSFRLVHQSVTLHAVL